MKLTDQGIDVLCDREGCRLTAYYDSVGVLTIGYGHTSAAGAPTVYQGMTITQKEAQEIFSRDVASYEAAVLKTIKVAMAPHEFDAYTSLCYNIGPGGFSSSTTAKRFNAGDKKGAAEAILWWNIPSEIMDRRRGEYYQFLGRCAEARVPASGPPAGATPVSSAPQKTPIPVPEPINFSSVNGLQAVLKDLGYGIAIDGKYGPATGAALAQACRDGALLLPASIPPGGPIEKMKEHPPK